jgi:serine/threonine protein kinase
MKRFTSSHPTQALLAEFGLGRLPAQEQAEIEEHISQCSDCCQFLKDVPDDTLLNWLRSPTQGPGRHIPERNKSRPQAAAQQQEAPPELIDHPRYRVVEVLGTGGMGTVYKAEHRIMERMVALKVINRSCTRNPGVIKRFHREVKNAARLQHPNIVTAHDADQAGDLHFLVMEYVPGRTLAQVLEKSKRLPVAAACHYIRQAAQALQHAHKQGMIHRDIKPHNLMLTSRGRIKVLDFGLSRLVDDQNRSAAGKRATALTQLGSLVGTIPYMSHEQACNPRAADIRSDIYSLGCTLYHMLAGQVPFPLGTATEQMVAHLEQKPRPLTEIRSDVPAGLDKVVQRMLAKNPADRFQTPAQVAQALEPFIDRSSSSTAPRALPAVVPVPSRNGQSPPPPALPLPSPARLWKSRHRRSSFPRTFALFLSGLAVLGCAGMLLGALLLPHQSNPTQEPRSEKNITSPQGGSSLLGKASRETR